MRALTPAMLAAMTGQETGEVFIVLVTIAHAAIVGGPARFSSDPTERHSDTPLIYKTVSRGNDYYFVPMEITLPDDVEDTPPRASVRVSNVGRELIAAVRSITTPAAVTMELILASAPDDVGITLPVFDLVAADYDAEAIQLSLTVESMASEPYPAGSFDPSGFPALHAGVG